VTPFSLHERSQAFVCDRKSVASHPLVFPCLRASRSSFTRRLGNAGVPTALVDTFDIPSFDMTLWR